MLEVRVTQTCMCECEVDISKVSSMHLQFIRGIVPFGISNLAVFGEQCLCHPLVFFPSLEAPGLVKLKQRKESEKIKI
jgi:hypothetical protein